MTTARAPRRTPLLIGEDEQSLRDILVELFSVLGNDVTAVATLEEALAALAARPYTLLLTDLRLGGRRDGGLQVMAAAGLLSPDATVIVLTAYPDHDNRHASLRLGAVHFLEKPVDLHTLAAVAAQAGVSTAVRTAEPRPALSLSPDDPAVN